MIRQFFKEYCVWYVLYLSMTGLYLLTFYLYRLPMSYFLTSLILNLTILVLVSLWQFFRFKQKLTTLHHFIYVNELQSLTSPSDLAYSQIIKQLTAAEAEQVLQSKNQIEDLQSLIKMWTHQMKVPLAALSLMAQTEELEPSEVRQQLLRLQNYLDTLLAYLKFNQHKDDFRFENCSVRELMTDLVKKYRVSFLVKHLSVDLQGDWQLKTDKKWLGFALSQILDNAIKYSKVGGQIKIVITNKSIAISDNGIGILDEDLPRLFEEGFTGYNGHEHQKATGLGLYMTKKVLDQLDFSISIKSQVEQGTTVTISR